MGGAESKREDNAVALYNQAFTSLGLASTQAEAVSHHGNWKVRTGGEAWELAVPINVYGRIFIGSMATAYDHMALQSLGITHVLNMNNYEGHEEAHRPGSFEYLILNVSSDGGVCKYFHGTGHFIYEGRSAGGVLVHCGGLHHLAIAAVLAYLMAFEDMHFREAASIVSAYRPFELPHSLYEDLSQYEMSIHKQTLHESRLRSASPYSPEESTSARENVKKSGEDRGESRGKVSDRLLLNHDTDENSLHEHSQNGDHTDVPRSQDEPTPDPERSLKPVQWQGVEYWKRTEEARISRPLLSLPGDTKLLPPDEAKVPSPTRERHESSAKRPASPQNGPRYASDSRAQPYVVSPLSAEKRGDASGRSRDLQQTIITDKSAPVTSSRDSQEYWSERDFWARRSETNTIA